ncbi:MAG: YihY/virulence factor BrkB family protein [Rhodospirillaceae bacterium]
MTSRIQSHRGKGRHARSPLEVGWKGWLQVAVRIWKSVGRDNLSVNAGGVAFYSMLAIFPAFTAFVLLYGLIADPADVQRQFISLQSLIPNDAWRLLNEQLSLLTARASSELGWGILLSTSLAIWSSGSGIRALMSALNVVYGEYEERNLLEFFGTAVLLTIGGIFSAMISLLFIVGTPLILRIFLLEESVEIVLDIAVWFVLAGMMIFGLGILFRFGPCRRSARSRWITLGSVTATVIWVAASAGFSFFVRSFGNYQEMYGAVGAMIVLQMWFWVTAFVVLLGAELNAQLELQTMEDTTVGPDRPMGQRGAYVADHIAESSAVKPSEQATDRKPE